MTVLRNKHRSAAAICLTVILAGAGCNDTGPDPNTSTADSAGRVELPYNPDPPKEAKIFATLVGDPEFDGGCLWLRQAGTDLSVLWPPGFTAEFNPARLYNTDGNLVAQEGDRVELTGSFAVDASTYQPHRCVVGSALWLTGQVSVTEG